MTLATLLSEPLPQLAELRELWLVFPSNYIAALQSAQTSQSQHFVNPITLTDGRLALSADLLTEISDGGLFASTFLLLSPNAFENVEVITSDQFYTLQPAPTEE